MKSQLITAKEIKQLYEDDEFKFSGGHDVNVLNNSYSYSKIGNRIVMNVRHGDHGEKTIGFIEKDNNGKQMLKGDFEGEKAIIVYRPQIVPGKKYGPFEGTETIEGIVEKENEHSIVIQGKTITEEQFVSAKYYAGNTFLGIPM